MAKKLLFVFNPHAGKGKIRTVLFDIIDMFTKAGYDVTAYPTQKPGDCSVKVKESGADYEIVVASGGDGTLSEAVSGMLSLASRDRRPIGYIPAGTTNDFASGNGISKTMTNAAEEIINGKTIHYDIGHFNDEIFIYVAAFGAFTDVSYDTPQMKKNLFGQAAYLFEGIKRIPQIEGVNIRVRTDEGVMVEEEVLWCFIMNSTRVAGFEFGEFYDIDTGDGLFEIVIIPKTTNIIDYAAVINDIRNGVRDADGVKVITTKGAVIDIEKPVRWTIDGEFGGETDHVEFAVEHNAVEFIFTK